MNFLMLVPVAAQPTVLSVNRNGANIVISFQSKAGSTYQLQSKTTLLDSTWAPLGSSIPGDGAVKQVTDPIAGASRFYRLSVQ